MKSNAQGKLPSEKSFGLVFAVFFTLMGAYPLISGRGPRTWSFVVAAMLVLISYASPNLLAIPNKIWARFGEIMHKITQPLILGIVFFAVITPFGLLIRLFGVDLLRLKKKAASESYWSVREESAEKPNMKLQF